MDYQISDLKDKVVEQLPFLPKEAAEALFEVVVQQLFSNV